MNEDLKPCPFCGEPAKIVDSLEYLGYDNLKPTMIGIKCSGKCGIEMGWLKPEDKHFLIAAWNARSVNE